MSIHRLTRLLTGTMLPLLFCSLPARASVIDFEGFTSGTVNGQGGWTVEDSFGNGVTPYD